MINQQQIIKIKQMLNVLLDMNYGKTKIQQIMVVYYLHKLQDVKK